MLSDNTNRDLDYSGYSGTPPYDHPVYKTTSLLRPYSFKPNVKTLSHFIILKTPLMRPPRYYDQDFMAQRWSYYRGSTVLRVKLVNKVLVTQV